MQCNDLKGDEDMVIFQTVHLDQNQYIEAFLSNSLSRRPNPPALLLVFWPPDPGSLIKDSLGGESQYRSLIALASWHSVPLLDLTATTRRSSGGAVAACTKGSTGSLYADSVHPNEMGHLLIAALLAEMINGLPRPHRQLLTDGPHRHEDQPAGHTLDSVPPMFPESKMFGSPQCFSMVSEPSKWLQVTNAAGFKVKERLQKGIKAEDGAPAAGRGRKFKRCWEANSPGDHIDIWLPPSTSIMLEHYIHAKADMGMATVSVDGKVYIERLNGWFGGYNWTKGKRGGTGGVWR